MKGRKTETRERLKKQNGGGGGGGGGGRERGEERDT